MRGTLLTVLAFCLTGCGSRPAAKVIVFGVDGMDPGFVERHWKDLPALDQLRHEGSFSRLATTDPPQSPVAWSTFITGLDPGEHGIFDFVHRDPATHEAFLSISRTTEARFRIPLGPYEIPLARGHVEQLRHGRPFWENLTSRGVPVSIVRIPANFPPSEAGEQLSGMGVPDLRGTQGEYTLITRQGTLDLQGPANPLRRDHARSTAKIQIDIDPERPVGRVRVGDREIVLNEGEWSEWLPVEFPLIPHLAGTGGIVRIFAKQFHPEVAIYVSPINLDPRDPALPISAPRSLAADYAEAIGPYPTLGIPQDSAALRNGIITHAEFLAHTRDILNTERRLLSAALDRYKGGLLFFYFSSVDQNSHILWGKYEAELLEYYRAVDAAVANTRRREPSAKIIVMSDHGFTTFTRAVNLNAWLRQEGLLATDRDGKVDWSRTRAWALGLNALYLSKDADAADIRRRLLELRDPGNGQFAITSVTTINAAKENRAVAPSMTVGYAPGYRASWATGLGDVAAQIFETNGDAWIADHCVDPTAVPGVLFVSRGIAVRAAAIKELPAAIQRLY